jgi:hypothetical protein
MTDEKEINYQAVIADIERRRAAYNAKVDMVVAQLRQLAGAGTDEEIPGSGGQPTVPDLGMARGEVPRNAFSRMNYPEAVRAYLELTNRKQTARDIAAGLTAGGMHTTSKNFYANVYTTLQRLEEKGIVARPTGGKEWGLAEWYRGLRNSAKRKSESEPEHDAKEPNEGAA